MTKKEQSKICDVSGGTGQLSYFKGVSRFLLSHDECPECTGTGHRGFRKEPNRELHYFKKKKNKNKKIA